MSLTLQHPLAEANYEIRSELHCFAVSLGVIKAASNPFPSRLEIAIDERLICASFFSKASTRCSNSGIAVPFCWDQPRMARVELCGPHHHKVDRIDSYLFTDVLSAMLHCLTWKKQTAQPRK